MYKDNIIAEVWRNRDAYAREHHYNLDEMVADLRKREQVCPNEIVNRRICRISDNGDPKNLVCAQRVGIRIPTHVSKNRGIAI